MKILNLTKNQLILAVILILALVLRFSNLYWTPGWFPDELVNLEIAWNLLHGKMQFYAISYPFVPHPPLFFIICLPFLAIFGKSILALRIISATFGLVNVFLIYLLIKEVSDNKKALLSSLFYAIFSIALINGRYGLSYEFFLSLFFLTFYLAARFNNTKNQKHLLWASFLAGIASVTSFLGIILIPLVWILAWIKSRRNFLRVFAISLLPFLVYFALMLIIMKPAFINDLFFTVFRPEIASDKSQGLIGYYGTLFGSNLFSFLGLIGMFLLPKNNYKIIILILFIVLSAFEFKIKQTTFYSTPFIMLGLSNIVFYLYDYLNIWLDKNSFLQYYKRAIIIGIIGLLIFIPFALSASLNFEAIINRRWLGINQEEWYSPNNLESTNKVADYINRNTSEDDLVLTSPFIASLINARVVEPLQAIAYLEKATTFYPANLKSTNRFIYEIPLNKVKYAVIDKYVRNWYVFQPHVQLDLYEKFWNSWQKVYIVDEYIIFKNPYVD